MMPFCLLPRLCSSCSAKVLADGCMWCTKSARNFLTEELCLSFPDTVTILVIILYLLHLPGNDFTPTVKYLPAIHSTQVQSPGKRNGYPLQHSCLENSMDRGAEWATVHGIKTDLTEQLTFGLSFTCHVYLVMDPASKKINVASEFWDIAGQFFADLVFAGLCFLTSGLPIHSLSFYHITLSLGQLLLL